MAQLADYPISFPFGATSAPYSTAHPHRGDDRAAPINTPIIVKGTTIGFVGLTGNTTGPHCHIQEWKTTKDNVRKPQNAFKGGTVIEVDSAGTSGDGSFGKYVTIQSSDGWNDSYCHMSSVSVKVGDVIKENIMTKNEAYTVVDGYYQWGTGKKPTPDQSEYWASRLATNPTGNQELHDAMEAEAKKPTTGTKLSKGSYYVE